MCSWESNQWHWHFVSDTFPLHMVKHIYFVIQCKERVTCAQDRAETLKCAIAKLRSATRFTAALLTGCSATAVPCSFLRKSFSAVPAQHVQLITILQPQVICFRCFGMVKRPGWGSLRTAFGTHRFSGLPCKLWLLRKHGLTNHSAVTSACLSLPPIHSCYPQWLTIAPFELPAKPQIELLLTGVQLDEWEEADIHSLARVHPGSKSLAILNASVSLSQRKPLQVYWDRPLPLSVCGTNCGRLLASDD